MNTFIPHLRNFFEQLVQTVLTGNGPVIILAIFGCLLVLVIFSIRRRAKELHHDLEKAENELADAKKELTEIREDITRHKIREARLVTLIRTERRNSAEKLALLETAREELRLQFGSLAQEIFEDKSATFSNQSKERLEAMLKPFHLQLDALQNEIRDTFLNDTRERASLKKELHQLQEMNKQMGEEAVNLTRALKGDKKLQGNWGELVLERVLEQSGLRRGSEYETQLGYRDGDNRLFKPDVIIHLPEGKDIIIDSKVSLSAWERYCTADDDRLQAQALNDLITAVRNHIQSLGAKKYEELKGIQTLDFVMMFMPIEAAFTAAIGNDENLLTEAFSQKIIIVTPTTLLATLRTVESIWRYEHQSRNSLEIARRAGALYDKFRGFVEDMDKIGKQLETCRQTYDGAMNKLTQGRGNLISQAQQLTELGVQVKKELPRTVTEQTESELRN
ncbi:DNA recombination protein RmuC [Desulfopila aestuarii]|uniref:DNA recombination protein RmuC n=1 Tax=Desulfopila aestuarii DSM 18488 TaxID=1121416 RepID=A0A1M7Y732_9BACT|nr:DNA recombination protein RmuC [Desulfopila aestuarii]SHO48465.1 DNA recombination protein RmuC [Desulfopila aestuarii DSM 18488]